MTKPPHTLIYTHGGGRLGNQILRFAHWIAWAREHEGQVEVLNLSFWPFASLFSVWEERCGCAYPTRPGLADKMAQLRAKVPGGLLTRKEWRVQRLVHALGRWRPGWQAIAIDRLLGESLDLEGSEFFQRIACCPVTTCSGWNIAGWNLFARHQVELRELFRPASGVLRLAREFIGSLRARHDVIVGLLIRQTDYQAWRGGRFCFPTEVYVQWIRQLLDLHAGRRVAIVIAADAWQDPALFAGLPCYFATGSINAGGHWFESFVELSLCDLVLSPPSTFSAMAAFIGAVPLWPVVAADQRLAFDQIISEGIVGAARHPFFCMAVN
jgi:hypothetical protein